MIVVVTYDLRKSGRDYADLYAELKRKPYRHDLESTWLLETSESPDQVFDRLSKHLDDGDALLITAMTSPPLPCGSLPTKSWEWILARI